MVPLAYLNERRKLARAYLDFVASQNVPGATGDAVYHRAWIEHRKAESDFQIASAQEQMAKRERVC